MGTSSGTENSNAFAPWGKISPRITGLLRRLSLGLEREIEAEEEEERAVGGREIAFADILRAGKTPRPLQGILKDLCTCTRVYVCRCTCVQVCRCVGVHVCRCASVHVCRCAGVHVCRCACVHVCRSVGVHVRMCAGVQVCMCACVYVCMCAGVLDLNYDLWHMVSEDILRFSRDINGITL